MPERMVDARDTQRETQRSEEVTGRTRGQQLNKGVDPHRIRVPALMPEKLP